MQAEAQEQEVEEVTSVEIEDDSEVIEESSEEQQASSDEDSDDEQELRDCLLYTSPSPRDRTRSRMPSSA